MASSPPLVVAAIDFGTTFSGWAYSFLHEFRSDATKVKVKLWHSGCDPRGTEKTPTCALIKPDGKTLDSFGYDAENRYKILTENKEHMDYYYFRRFKMALNQKKLTRDLKIVDELGKEYQAIEVFALSIAFLVDDLLKTATDTVRGGVFKKDIDWVITVPAIWSDGAKQFMREAAVKAGIETNKLRIALEPEAASIFCRCLPLDKCGEKDSISNLPPGTKYIVLDAGGGTIDITVHQVTDSGGLKEVHAASGGGWGGILVDDAFKNLMIDVLGQPVYDKFVENETEDWIDLWRNFECKKKMITPSEVAATCMKLPLSLILLYESETGKRLVDRIAESKYSSTIELRGDKIRFGSKVMKDFFNESIKTTLDHVKSILEHENVGEVKAILMVGGFSEAPILQDAVKREFVSLKVIIPKDASSSILRGAVAFGHNPNSISQRIVKKTYGTRSAPLFKAGIHPEYLKYTYFGTERCNDIFTKHVEIGQTVNIGECQVEKRYFPLSVKQKEIEFRIYASDLNNPMYTDQGCEHIGDISVDVSDLSDDLEANDRTVFVSLTLSGTEITASARVEKTGKITTATFDCLG